MQLSANQSIEITSNNTVFILSCTVENLLDSQHHIPHFKPCINQSTSCNKCYLLTALYKPFKIFNKIPSTDSVKLRFNKEGRSKILEMPAQDAAFFCILYSMANSSCPIYQALHLNEEAFNYSLSSESFIRISIINSILIHFFKNTTNISKEKILSDLHLLKNITLESMEQLIAYSKEHIIQDAFINALVTCHSTIQLELWELRETYIRLSEEYQQLYRLREKILKKS